MKINGFTDMTTRRWIIASGFIAVLIVITAGLMVAGGPVQGRMDQNDRGRFGDISSMLRVLECHYRVIGTFPENFEKQQIVAECRQRYPAAPNLSDRISQQPYPYVFQPNIRISVCASFASTQQRLLALFGKTEPDFTPETGCITIIRD